MISDLTGVDSPHQVLEQPDGSLAGVTAGNVDLVVESGQAVGVGAVPPGELLAGHQGPELCVVLHPALVVHAAHQAGPLSPDGPHQVPLLLPPRASAPTPHRS